MCENEQVITPPIRGYEAEAFLIVEPFTSSGLSVGHALNPRSLAACCMS